MYKKIPYSWVIIFLAAFQLALGMMDQNVILDIKEMENMEKVGLNDSTKSNSGIQKYMQKMGQLSWEYRLFHYWPEIRMVMKNSKEKKLEINDCSSAEEFNSDHQGRIMCEATNGRGNLWMRLSGAQSLLNEHPGLYEKLKSQFQLTEVAEAEIRKDVYRTNRQDDLWTAETRIAKQEEIYNVLKVYSCFLKQVGYCQGMGCVSALLLSELNEESTFWIMVALTIDPRYKLLGFWHPKMPEADEIFQNMEKLVEVFFPDLAEHFRHKGVESCTMYGVTTWFITIFVASNLPISLVREIWDVYFEFGIAVIYKIGLGILENHREDLLKLEFEDIIQNFQKDFYRINDNDFVQQCMTKYILPEFLMDELKSDRRRKY